MAISVIINTYNSALHLAKVLDSVSDFDEVVVCDMESTDNTIEIAKSKGARVVTFPKKHYTYCEPARNFAISQARFDWVFVVNADELVSPELRGYLYKFVLKPGKAKGLYIPRRSFILDRFRHDVYPDYNLRFFVREAVDWPAEIHSKPVVDGEVKKIPANRKDLALIQIPASIDHMIERINRYSTAEMETMKDKKVGLFHILTYPFFRFVKTYFLNGAVHYGTAGFILAFNDSVYSFYRLAKIYEFRVGHKMPGKHSREVPEEVLEEIIAGYKAEKELIKEQEKDTDANK